MDVIPAAWVRAVILREPFFEELLPFFETLTAPTAADAEKKVALFARAPDGFLE